MRICKRCKINDSEYGSLNCSKCNKRNDHFNENLVSNKTAKPPVKENTQSIDIGSEWDKGVAGHLENI